MMEEHAVQSSELTWEPLSGDAKMKRKILRKGGDGRPRVALLRLEPGFEMEAHSHAYAENHYVLEGMYESHGREFRAGAYRRIPTHAGHGPFRSRGGALVLVFWED